MTERESKCKYDDDCNRPLKLRGYCNLHYNRLRQQGLFSNVTPDERFVSKLQPSDELFEGTPCLLWSGGRTKNGYALLNNEYVHRYAYRTRIGPIPENSQIDHRCHNEHPTCTGGFSCMHRACANELHLEAVLGKENTRRGRAGPKERCKRGHLLAEPNLLFNSKGKRNCKKCARDLVRSYTSKKRRNRVPEAFCGRCGIPLQRSNGNLQIWQHRSFLDRPPCSHPPEVKFTDDEGPEMYQYPSS